MTYWFLDGQPLLKVANKEFETKVPGQAMKNLSKWLTHFLSITETLINLGKNFGQVSQEICTCGLLVNVYCFQATN